MNGLRAAQLTRLCGAVCLLLAVMAQAPQDSSKTPRALEGMWNIESSNGQKLSSLGQNGTIEFTRENYTVTMNGRVTERGSYKLDIKAKPTQIDMKITEGVGLGYTQIGLVQVLGDELTLKTNTIGTPKRPTDFTHELWYVLIVAKKKK